MYKTLSVYSLRYYTNFYHQKIFKKLFHTKNFPTKREIKISLEMKKKAFLHAPVPRKILMEGFEIQIEFGDTLHL